MIGNSKYKIGSDTYDIPDSEVQNFLKDNPSAIELETFKVDKTVYDIPITEKDSFLKDFPTAESQKKKQISGQDALTSASGQKPLDFLGQSGENLLNPQSTSQEPQPSLSDNSVQKTDTFTSPEQAPQIEQPKAKTVGEWVLGGVKAFDQSLASLAGALDYVHTSANDAINQVILGKESAVEIKKLRDKGIIVPGINPVRPFQAIEDAINYAHSGAKPLPENVGGAIVGGTAAVVPDILAAIYAPEVQLPKMFSKLGLQVGSKFGMVMGAKSAIAGAEANENQSTFNKVEAPILGAIEGYMTGWMFDGIGAQSAKIGEKIAEKVIPKAVTPTQAIDKALVQQGGSMLSNAIFFGGYGNADEYLRTGTISAETFATNAGMGIALGLREPAKLLYAKGLNAFIATPKEAINRLANSPISTEELSKKAQDKIDAIEKGDSPDREGDLAAAKFNANLANLNAIVDEIRDNKEEVIKNVNESNLEPKAKEIIIDKINEVDADNDPKVQAIKGVNEKIAQIDEQLQSIRDNKSWDETRKDVESAPLKEKKLALKEEATTILNKPIEGELKLGDKTFKDKEELTNWLDKNYNEKDRFTSVNEDGYLESNTMRVFNEWYKQNKERLRKEDMARIEQENQAKPKEVIAVESKESIPLGEEKPLDSTGDSKTTDKPLVTDKKVEEVKPINPVPTETNPNKLADEVKDVEWYHGTKSGDLTKGVIDPWAYGDTGSLVGLGLYTTADTGIARKYAGQKGRIFKFKFNPSKVINGDTPLTQDVIDAYKKSFTNDSQVEWGGVVDDYIKNNSKASLVELHKAILEEAINNEVSKDSVTEMFQEVAFQLSELGYDGITHEGGKALNQKTRHRVLILLDPESVYKTEKNNIISSKGEYVEPIQNNGVENNQSPVKSSLTGQETKPNEGVSDGVSEGLNEGVKTDQSKDIPLSDNIDLNNASIDSKVVAKDETSPKSGSNVPPTDKVAKNGDTEGTQDTRERTLGVRALNSDRIDQDIKDGIQKEGTDYIPRGRKIRSEEAKEIINLFSQEEGGLDKVSEMVYNTQNGIEGDTRTFLNVYLADKYNQLKNSSDKPAEQEKLRQKVVDLYMFGMEQGTKGGQVVEAQKEWGKVFGNSPEMVQALVRKHIEDKRKGFFQSKEEEISSAKKLLDELFNSEEGKKRIEDEVSAEISKIGTTNFGVEGKKKVDDFFKGLLIDPKQQQFYDALLGIPIAAWNGSVLAVKNAILLGMDVATAVQKGAEHLDKWYKENYEKGAIPSPDWNKKDYESHMGEKLGGLKKEVPITENKTKTKPTQNKKVKAKPTQEEVVNKLLEKMAGFATKKQLQNFVKDYFQEHFDKGVVSDQRYKDLLAKALGMEYMNPKTEAELTASAQALGHAQKKMQELQDAFDKILATDPTSPEFKELRKELDKLKKDVDKANFNAQKANQKIKTLLTDEAGLWDKVGTLIQGNFLVPASLLKNIYGNVFMGIPRATRFMVMNAVDAAMSAGGKGKEMLKIDPVKNPTLYRMAQKLPNAERTVKMGASMRGYREGAIQGLKEGLRQVKTGQLEDDYQKKEIQRGLEPVKAAIRIWDNLTGAEKRKWDQTVGDVLEALPAGYMGEGMFRMLNLGDKPFRRGAEQARLSEIADIKGYKGIRREQFMLNPDNASLEDAQKTGDIAVYTNDNLVSKLIQYANQTISKGEKSNEASIKTTSAIAKALFKLGKATTLPYVRTPVNLMAEAFEYAIPAYSLARSVESAYKGKRRESLDFFGKAVVGTILSSAAITLIQSGVMTPGASDDEKTKQAEYTGKEGYRLNMDALQRLIKGELSEWQDGDNTVTLKGYGTLSMIFMAYADAYKDKTPEEMDAARPDWGSVFPSVVTSGLEQSIMTGVNTALQAALKGEKERDRWLINTAGAMSAAVYPNTITNISKTFADENYIRETRDISKEEGQFKAQMVNTFKDRMFMGKDLPTKVSIWGDKVNLIPDGNSWTYNLLGVSKNKKYQKYSFGTKMFELYEEYKKKDPDVAKNIFPMLPSPATKVGWDDAKMTPIELQDYQIRVGELRAEYAENYINSEEFKEAELDDKVQTLTSMYSKARKIAEKEMFDWTAYKERDPEKFQYLQDNDLLPLPSMVKKAGIYTLKPEDQEMLNDKAISYYGNMVQGMADKLNGLPQEMRVKMLNGQWSASINIAKAEMMSLLSKKE